MTTLNRYVVARENASLFGKSYKYPMKRKHFDPNGERHPELRGKDEYVRISWDEALDLVARESRGLEKLRQKRPLQAMASSHHNWACYFIKWDLTAASTICWATPNC